LKEIEVKYADDPENFKPYARDEKLVRPWAPAGTPGFEHRIGGLEKENITGDVSYDPQNHHDMCRIREEKIEIIADEIPELEVMGDKDADILVVGWGGTYGAITDAITDLRERGYKVAQVHFKYINPMPKNTEEVLKRYKHILVPEINFGQLAMIIKSEFLIPVHQFNLVRGLPFKSTEIEDKVIEILGGKND